MQRTLESLRIEEEMLARGYAEIDHEIDSGRIEELVECYADFTLHLPDPDPETMDAMLPKEDVAGNLDNLTRQADTQKEWHKYRTNAEGEYKPNGYTNRTYQASALQRSRGISIEEDGKEYYHFVPSHYSRVAQNHRNNSWGIVPKEVKALDTAFAGIHTAAVSAVETAVEKIEEAYPGVGMQVTEASLANSPLRLLFYHPGITESGQMAGGHYDKSLLTLQIAESHLGLRVATPQSNELVPVIREANKAALFPGLRIEDHVPDEDEVIAKAWHDVVELEDYNQGRNVPLKALDVCARWSLIFFVNGANQPKNVRELTHNR